ncbi:MAG: nitrate- and nitrite sensing domain-containing protein [Dermatophilaceae bacterium]
MSERPGVHRARSATDVSGGSRRYRLPDGSLGEAMVEATDTDPPGAAADIPGGSRRYRLPDDSLGEVTVETPDMDQPGAATDVASGSRRYRVPDASQRYRRVRQWLADSPIRIRVAVILLVPLLALVVVSSVQVAVGLRSASVAGDTDRLAQLNARTSGLVSALQEERTAAAVVLGDDSPDRAVAQAFAARVEVSTARFEAWSGQAAAAGDVAPAIRARIGLVSGQVQRLSATRSDVINRRLSTSVIADQYSSAIGDLLVGQGATLGAEDLALSRATAAASAYSAFQEASAEEQALLAGALSTGEVGVAEGVDVIGSLNAQQDAFADFAAAATISQRKAAARAIPQDAAANVTRVEQQALRATRTGSITADLQQWLEASGSRLSAIRAVNADLVESVSQRASQVRRDAYRSALLNAGWLLVVFLSALLIGVVIARSMVRPIQQLRAAALEAAYDRLPAAVRAAQAGERVPDDGVQPLRGTGRDEIGQLAVAFMTIQDEAVRVASEQATRRRETAVLVNTLARRSQTQVEQAMSRIDAMEKEEADADRLGEIFDLDHAVTRMRRTNESLMVLTREHTGSDTPWTRPEPVRQVLQAALGEIEQYQRIEVTAADEVASGRVSPTAVKDVIHLLAELLENATSFSSPRTTVIAEAQRVGDRLVVEIEDSGLGLSADQVEQINDRLRKPPELDVAVARQMGLYVVARLAAIHRIDVSLRRSRSGGIVAIVELPASIVAWHTSGGRPPEPSAFPSLEPAEPAVVDRPAPSSTTRPVLTPPARPEPVRHEPAVPEPVPQEPAVPTPVRDEPAGPVVDTPTRTPSAVPVMAADRPVDISDVAPPQTADSAPGSGTFGSPIFDQVQSQWFVPGQRAAQAPPPDRREWVTAADAGWAEAHRVAAASADPAPQGADDSDEPRRPAADQDGSATPDDLGRDAVPVGAPIPTTLSGLPKRVPLANLVPGAVASPSPAAARSPLTRAARGATPPGRGGRPHRAVATTLRSFTAGADRGRVVPARSGAHVSADPPEGVPVATGRDQTQSQED